MHRGQLGLGVTVGALLAVLGGSWILGSRLPEERVTTLSVRIESPPEAVWRTVTDFEHAPEWRPDVAMVELGRSPSGKPAFVEVDPSGKRASFVVEQARFPDLLMLRRSDEGGAMGATWTLTITPEQAGCELVLTEAGWDGPPLARAWVHHVLGEDAALRAYVEALGARLGEELEPLRVR